MALAEFLVIETAYRALARLDQSARTRALGWLTDALGAPDDLPEAVDVAGTGPATRIVAPVESPTEEVAETPHRNHKAVRKTAPAAGGEPRESARVSGARSATRVRAAKAVTATDATETEGGRAYRRMPLADEVLAAYRQVGTVSGLAEYFGVPRHTVSGWARRLRGEGYDIGRSR